MSEVINVDAQVDDEITVVSEEESSRPDRRRPRKWHESPRRIVLLLAATFAAIEAVGAFWSVPAQAVLLAWAAFFTLNLAIFGYRTQRTAGLVMTALFVNRLVVLGFPAYGVSTTTRIGIIAIFSIVIAYIATWVLSVDVTSGRSNEGLALKKPMISRSFTSAITVLAGFPIGIAAYNALGPSELVQNELLGSAIVPWAVAVGALLLGALGEELTYRRLVAAMVQHTGQSQTPWVSAAIYGAAFLPTKDVALIALMTMVGAFFAWSCERTGSIRPVVASHAVASVLVFIVLPAA